MNYWQQSDAERKKWEGEVKKVTLKKRNNLSNLSTQKYCLHPPQEAIVQPKLNCKNSLLIKTTLNLLLFLLQNNQKETQLISIMLKQSLKNNLEEAM